MEQLASILSDVPVQATPDADSFHFLTEVSVPPSSEDINNDDFSKLILRGFADLSKLRSQNAGSPQDRFCIDRRQAADIILEGASAFTRRFVVSSDFGNGKSIFLKQLAIQFLERGYRVVLIESKSNEAFGEIDAAVRTGLRFVFIIDDVIRYREVAQYIGSRVTNNITVVCTTRGEHDERSSIALADNLGGAVRYIDLNRLNADEIDQWDAVLERWGYWERRIELHKDARQRFLTEECGSENRSIVLSLFKNSRIAEQIDRIVEFFLRDTRVHIRAFAALLISSLAQRHVSWESLVAWLDIDEDQLRADIARSEIASLFLGGRSWNAFTSSQLAEFILRNRFVASDRDVLLDAYSTIVLRSAASASDGRSGLDARENLKELMKFRFLTRLFGDEAEAVSLIGSVYQRLSKAPRIRSNPQFWLQFAMSRMAADDLEPAEAYLETAIGLARDRGGEYSPFQILDQRARLYLIKNSRKGDVKVSELTTALRDLSELLSHKDYEVIYPFRAIPLVRDLLEEHIDNLTLEVRHQISEFIAALKNAADGLARLPRSQKGETQVLFKALREASLIVRNA